MQCVYIKHGLLQFNNLNNACI